MATNKNTSIDKLVDEANAEMGNAVPTKPVVGTLEAKAAREYTALEAKRKSLVYAYRNEEKVNVTISPFYAPYLGRVVRESVNGIIVDVPADGQTYAINKTHADHIIAKIKRIDAMIARQKRAGDVSNNFEQAPGELHL